ncbi:helix-turn-helix transcriptional regulator [Rathayibacter tritici]|uniref:helix-turn-helix transcriptional regulator n=1 Tax=Rathayibacter tritici TaxID=33888 RepID=UPI0011B07C8E|nr:helix-turn-helix transcriptional regulator [Rathayibacter tritici]
MSPKVEWPTPEARPVDVEIAILVNGNRSRAEVLRYLDTVTGATRGVIARETGIAYGTLGRVLDDLRRYGVVTVDYGRESTADDPSKQQGGLYSRNHYRLWELDLAWHNYTNPSRQRTMEQHLQLEVVKSEGSPALKRLAESHLERLRSGDPVP